LRGRVDSNVTEMEKDSLKPVPAIAHTSGTRPAAVVQLAAQEDAEQRAALA